MSSEHQPEAARNEYSQDDSAAETPPTPSTALREQGQRVRELALLFGRLGATAFGGPAAHIALMENEVVTRRGWMTRQQFLDLVGATNLIPGPNSTELAIHIGKLRAGWPGLVTAGVCFILPAFCIVLGLAWLYASYGALPQTQWLLRGVAPVVVAIVAHALWKFVATALKSWPARAVALLSIMLLILNVAELAVLGVAAALGLLMGWYMKRDAERTRGSTVDAPAPEPPDNNTSTRSDQTPRVPLLVFFAPALGGSAPVWALFWSFLKIGSILYGSGYVLIAFLQAEFVPQLLTQQQLLDAVAVGQVTPGPVFTTATFIGFQIAGWPGAVAATIGIFLPSFFFVALLSVLMEKLHRSLIMRGFLDAVNAASLALMAWATWLLSRSSLTDAVPILVMVVSLALLLKTRLNPTWLIAAGAVIGWFTSASA